MNYYVRTGQHTYLVGLPIGVFVLLLILNTNQLTQESNVFLSYALPITALLFSLIWITAWFHNTLNIIRRATFAVLSLFFILHFNSMMMYSSSEFISRELARSAPWLSVIYIMAYWVFGATQGGQVSFLYGAVTMITSVVIYSFRNNEADFITNLVTLIEINAASFVIILSLRKYFSVIESKTAEALRMSKLATEDRLTGLYNRGYIETVLKQEIEKVHRYHHELSFVLLDIDHFKKINDTYGHPIGDTILQEFARVLQSSVRASDFCGRWGGEEFVVVLSNTELERVLETCERLRYEVEKHVFSKVGQITVSIGVARYEIGETLDNFIERTDESLYKAKHQGRNQVVQYSAFESQHIS